MGELVRGLAHALAAVFNSRAAFKKRWQEFKPSEKPPNSITGLWQGEWTSEANGHHGELKCVLASAGAGQYEACFRGTFAKVLRVCYTVVLEGQETADGVRIKGEADLGMLAGGVYQCEGRATPTELVCSYRCKYDHGNFQLKKVN